MLKISVILLAAGLSRRMGRDKLMLELNGKTILQHSVDLLLELPVYERILVTTEPRLHNLKIPADVKVILNNQPERGQSESIRIGTNAAKGTHLLFLPADQPKLTPDDIEPLLDAAASEPGKIVYPIVNNQPCSPTIFPAIFREELIGLSSDSGGSVIRNANKNACVGIVAENPLNFTDIDTMEDFELCTDMGERNDNIYS